MFQVYSQIWSDQHSYEHEVVECKVRLVILLQHYLIINIDKTQILSHAQIFMMDEKWLTDRVIHNEA